MSKFKAGDLALNLQDIPSCISAGGVGSIQLGSWGARF